MRPVSEAIVKELSGELLPANFVEIKNKFIQRNPFDFCRATMVIE